MKGDEGTMKCRNWEQIVRTEMGDAFQTEYAFEGMVNEEWIPLIVNANVTKSLLATWTNHLWPEEYQNIDLNDTQWRVIEKIVFDETKTMVERRLQRGVFENGSTMQLDSPISLSLDVDSLPHPND
jgi:hypothetical protein